MTSKVTQLSPEELEMETPRLRLRPYAESDLDISIEVMTDPEVVKYVCDPMSEAELAAKIGEVCRRGAGGRIGMWCVLNKQTGEKLGDGVLTPIPIEDLDTDWASLTTDAYPEGWIEVGYMLKRSAWGQGFASEICARLLRFAFEQTTLAEVVACTDHENHASQRVLTKSGMRAVGLRRAYAEDVPWFVVTRAEWHAQQSPN